MWPNSLPPELVTKEQDLRHLHVRTKLMAFGIESPVASTEFGTALNQVAENVRTGWDLMARLRTRHLLSLASSQPGFKSRDGET